LTGNENALNSADTARAIPIQPSEVALPLLCYRGTLNIGQTLNSCPTAKNKEGHDP